MTRHFVSHTRNPLWDVAGSKPPPLEVCPFWSAAALRILRRLDGTGQTTAANVGEFFNVVPKTITTWETEPGKFATSPCRNALTLAYAHLWDSISAQYELSLAPRAWTGIPLEVAGRLSESEKEELGAWRAGVTFVKDVHPTFESVYATLKTVPSFLWKTGEASNPALPAAFFPPRILEGLNATAPKSRRSSTRKEKSHVG